MAFPWAAVAGLAGSLWSSSQNQASAEASMAFQREVLQNRYQWQVEDMRKAGINPMLAAGSSPGGASGGATYNTENPGSSAMQAHLMQKQMEIQERQQRNQDAIAESTVKLNDAKGQYELARATTEGEKSQYGFYQHTGESLQSSAEANRSQVELNVSRMKEIDAHVRRLESELSTAIEQRKVLVAQVANLSAGTRRSNIEASLAKKNIEIAELAKKGQRLINAGHETANALQNLQVPAARVQADYHSNWIGAAFDKLGYMIKSVSPFTR